MLNLGATILNAVIERSPLTAQKFAETLEISGAHLSRLRSGVRIPSRKLALVIERRTGGAVSVSTWDEAATPKPAARAKRKSETRVAA